MKTSKIKYSWLLMGVMAYLCGANNLRAQNSAFLGDGIQDYIRREQLLGRISIDQSLTNSSFSKNLAIIDTARTIKKWYYLPATLELQTNGHHAYGWNDGPMIPAKGFQTLLSAGVAWQQGKFSVQFRPEFVYANNPDFETFSIEQGPYWTPYYKLLNKIDLPERFGDKAFVKLFPGQSSIRFNTGAISIGISTENLWWGPGMRNSLMMSNSAPGFLHGTINTTRPIQTGIGSFEGQLIAGRLTASGISPPERNRYDSTGKLLYEPKTNASRYLLGIQLSWQPKWIKGLFLGFTKLTYAYRSDMNSLGDFLLLDGIIVTPSEKNGHKAALGSLFARLTMPEEKAELYMEYGRQDRSPSIVNVITDVGFPRAYMAGFRKLIPLKKNNQYIQLWSEFTQLESPTIELMHATDSWGTHPYVRQGYTNQGQSLGAGIGPGSNSQMLDVSWVQGFNKAGIMVERLVHNNDFFYNSYVDVNDFTRHWVDISTTFHIDWKLQKYNLWLSSQLAFVRSLNYEWSILPGLRYFSNGYDVMNVHGKLSLSYFF